MWSLRPLIFVLQLVCVYGVRIDHPEINFSKLGGRLTILGSYDSISFYSQSNASDALSFTPKKQDSQSNKLFLRNSKNDSVENFAEVNGELTSVQPLGGDATILINGDFDEFNQQSCHPPIIFNLTSREVTNLFSSPDTNGKRADEEDEMPSLDGDVKTTFIDGELIYLGGDFTFKNSSGALIYNTTSKQFIQLPFLGFGENSSVEAITKLVADDESEGSIIFGGKFNTLGIPDLLLHNISHFNSTKNHTNSTNTSLITAEQKIALKHGFFTDVNGDGSNPAELVCPSKSAQWAPQSGGGGQWLVELPKPMKDITPTKVRLYVPEGDDSINLFRIYSYPNNGIMNLTYIDPSTNELSYCDAWCPLSTLKQLSDATENNLDDIEDLDVDDVFIGEDDGTFSMYYDPSTQTKTLSYAQNFQEFAFENEVGIDQIGLTVISWHGDKGAVAGLELYTNQIYVYSNDTLNEPNCGEDADKMNSFDVDEGTFNSVSTIKSGLNTDYSISTGTDGKVTMFPNITYSGDYSIIILTPGCIADDSCDLRSIVNVTMYDTEGSVLATKSIWQNNDYDKFDYLFYGHLEGSTLSEGQNRIEMEFDSAIIPDTSEPWMVVDKIRADIVELDDYYDRNSTNRTRSRNGTDSDLVELKLSGLFEYSLANFSYFDEALIYGDSKDEISPYNLFVGNSTINVLSSELSNSSTVKQFNLGSDTLLILGEFDSNSTNLTLSNDNIIRLALDSYNTTSNSSISEIQKRGSVIDFDVDMDSELADFYDELEDFDSTNFVSLSKREDSTLFGATFNDSVTTISNYYNAQVLLGRFSMNNDDNSTVKITDLSDDNKTTTEANNFVLYDGKEFFSFGNDYEDETFDTFTNITIKSTEYFVFSNEATTKTWDNTKRRWITDSNRQLNITEAINLPDGRQIVSGSSFSIMDSYIYNAAYVNDNKDIKNGTFHSFDIDMDNGVFTDAYFINSSVSVLGGKFKTKGRNEITDIGFVSKDKFSSLQGEFTLYDNFTLQNLYVDSKEKYLVIGYNGSVEVNDNVLSGGIIIYDLQENKFTSFQPAQLSSSGSDSLTVNSIVLYNEAEKLLVGGQFENAGSLGCTNLCIYDVKNTRWESPNVDVSGEVTDLKFYTTHRVLVTGDFDDKFVTYNIHSDENDSIESLRNGLTSDDVIRQLVMTEDKYNDKLESRFVAVGDDFIKGYDGKKWHPINGIQFDNETVLTDVKLLVLEDSNPDNNETYFDDDKVLIVGGKFSLEEHGLVNVALYNGDEWIPLAFTATSSSQIGQVNHILVEDQFRFLSSEDIERNSQGLNAGKVVGISLACALGSTMLLSLLYIIPYLALFRRKDTITNERIGEKEMMDAVNPEDLFHEIDLQRHH